MRVTFGSLAILAILLCVLGGCGGSAGGLGKVAGGGTSGGTTGNVSLSGGSAAAIAATFQVNVNTGNVSVVSSKGNVVGGARKAPGMFTGNSIGFNSSTFTNITSVPTGAKVMSVSLVNNSGGTIGIDSTGALSGLNVIFGAFANTTGISSQAANTNVTTLAGSSSGYADGAASVAKFNEATGVAVGADGSLYIADFGNNRIRKISGGYVSTLAGKGTAGETDGPSTTATFNGPYGIAVNPVDGSLIVADYTGNKIRRITSTGVVNTVAGTGTAGSTNGAGSSATFTNPADVAVDSNGNIYVAEPTENRIRKITLAGLPNSSANYTVTTFAGSVTAGFADGNGVAASFSKPYGLCTDPSGNVYVGDYGNNAIRMVDPSANVTTIAGTGTESDLDGYGNSATFNRPLGVAFLNGTVFVSEGSGYVVREVVPVPGAGVTSSGWAVMTLAGTAGSSGDANGAGSSATFSSLRYLAASASSSLYVADFGNSQIRRINPSSGTFPIGTPTGTTNTSGDLVVLSNPTGLVASSDLGSSCPFINYPGSISPGQQSSALSWNFVIPQGVTSFQFQVIVEADTAELVSLQSASGAGSPLVDVRTYAGSPTENGYRNGTATGARFYGFGYTGLAIDGDGVLYYGDQYNNAIRRIDQEGNVTTIAGVLGMGTGTTNGAGNVAKFDNPIGVAVNQAGTEVFVADTNNDTIRVIELTVNSDPTNPADWTVYTIAGTPGIANGTANGLGSAATFGQPLSLAMSPGGTLYVTELGNADVRSLTYLGGARTSASSWDVQTLISGLSSVGGICCDRAENVYVSDGDEVLKVDPSENATVFAGSLSTGGYVDGNGSNALFSNPGGLCIDSAGYIYVADFDNCVIRRISPSAQVTTVAGIDGVVGTLNGAGNVATLVPYSLAISPSGDLFEADYSAPEIRKIQTVISSASGPIAK